MAGALGREWAIVTPVRTPEPRAKADAVVSRPRSNRPGTPLIAEVGSREIGEHLGHLVEGERLVTHYFASTHPGYRAWRWSVTVTRASRAKSVTVNEVVMLPGHDAMLAPELGPVADRVQPGDMRPGFLLPTEADDPRLEPGYTAADEAPDDEAVRSVVDELGLGRERVLSPVGRDEPRSAGTTETTVRRHRSRSPRSTGAPPAASWSG